ncbi:MAG: hypothetical protein ACREOQ_01265, partial [Gemmatimonadales bacterium]
AFAEGGQAATGGGRRGPGDRLLAWFDPMEFIVNPRATRRPGVLALLRAINAGRELRGFAAGGLVGGIGIQMAFPTVRAPAAPRAPTLDPSQSLAANVTAEQIIRLMVEHDPGLILQVMGSKEGQKVQVQTAKANKRKLGRVIPR